MRSSTLLFFHVLAGMVLVGGLLASAVAAAAARRRDDERGPVLRGVAWRSAAGAVVAAIVTVGLGEGLDARENVDATWLDVSRGLTIFGLLLGGVVLAALARFSRERPRLTAPVVWIAVLLVLVGLGIAFVMTAKPS